MQYDYIQIKKKNRVNAGRYSVSLRIQSECSKIRTRITPKTNNLYTVLLRRTKNKIPKNQKGRNVVAHCNIVNNDC